MFTYVILLNKLLYLLSKKNKMKKILIIIMFFVGFIFNACKSAIDTVKPLDLGMEKQNVLYIIGDDYAIETISETPNGRLEILRHPKAYYPGYFLVFQDGKLVEINRDNLPTVPQQNINVTKEKEN
mgnify:CR=1 FL=1